MHIIITLLAGLGLIFVGTHFLTANMKQAAGPRFRRMVQRATAHPVKAGLLGIGSGAVIQSTNAVTFIVVGLVSAGAISVRAGLPIVTWCYTGTTLRLFMVSIDLHVVTLGVLAIVGMLYGMGYNRSPRHGYLVGALLGLALLMLGVEQTANAAVPLKDSETARAILGFADRFYLWGLVAGTALAAAMQGMTVSIIALALADAGLLGIDQAILIVVGANLGSGIMSAFQGSALHGSERQLSLYQIVLKCIGTLVMVPLLLIEHYGGVPTVRSLVTAITPDAAFQLTLVHWIFQIVSALVATPLDRPLFRLITRMSPPSEEEELARPQFLRPEAVDDPVEAVRQVEREQIRLIRRLPDYLAAARGDEHGGTAVGLAILRRSGKALIGEIDSFLKEALRHAPSGMALDRLLQLWNAIDTLGALQETLAAFAQALPKKGADPRSDRVLANLTEGLHALLEVATLELEDGERVDAGLIETLTADRAALMQRVRDELSRGDPPLPPEQRMALWQATDLFERVTWLLRRYAWNLGAIGPVPVADAVGTVTA